MRGPKTQPVTVRLDRELHRQASAISKLTGESFRGLVERGLKREVEDKLDDKKLAEAVKVVASFG